METTTKQYNFLDQTLILTCQSTEHTIGLIQQEMSTYKSLFDVNFKPGDVILDLGAKGKKQINVIKEDAKPINAIEEELKAFVESIENNKVPKVSIYDGHRALQVALEITKKMAI